MNSRQPLSRRLPAAGVSVALHAIVGAAILWGGLENVPSEPPPEAVLVELVAPLSVQTPTPAPDVEPPPGPAAAEPESAAQAAVDPEPAQAPEPAPTPPLVRQARDAPQAIQAPAGPRPRASPRPSDAQPAEAIAPIPTVGGAQLAGAQTAGGGTGSSGGSGGAGSGGSCDMIRRLQDALRDDPQVQAEVARAYRAADADGRALLVWNGDWLRDPTQDGKGLAGVRQAISVEVAFAPRTCQAQAMRGLVLFSLSESASAPKMVLGRGAWTWSDLLDRRR